MGAYTAFLDVALGFGVPALGPVADFAGLGAPFAAGMLVAFGAAAIAAALMFEARTRAGDVLASS
jgi:hypothetical protein